MREKYWTDQGVKVYSTNMITGLYRFSKMELHKLEEKLIKENENFISFRIYYI